MTNKKMKRLVIKARKGNEKAQRKVIEIIDKKLNYLIKNPLFNISFNINDIKQEARQVVFKSMMRNYNIKSNVDFRTFVINGIKNIMGHLRAKNNAKKRFAETLSFDYKIDNDEKKMSFADIIPDENAYFEDKVLIKVFLEDLRRAISPTKRVILNLFLEGNSLAAISSMLNINYYQVRRNYKSIIKSAKKIIVIGYN